MGVSRARPADRRLARFKLGTALAGATMAFAATAATATAVVPSRFRLSTLVLPATAAAPVATRASVMRGAVPPQDMTVRPPVADAFRAPLAGLRDADAAPFAVATRPALRPARSAMRVHDLSVRPVRADATPGDVTVNDGDVVTSGDMMPGIATISPGATTITANSVTTNGYASPGIDARGTGDIGITVGTVLTQGTQSTGISAISYAGDVAINAQYVATSDASSNGIYASGHNVTIHSGGVNAGNLGILAYGNGDDAHVAITVDGPVIAYGRNASGIVGVSGGDLTITSNGDITTTKTNRAAQGKGIYGRATGDVTIDSEGRIKTTGPSVGIAAFSVSGDVTIKSNAIEAYSYRSAGINAYAGGKVTINAGDTLMLGDQSSGIVAIGGSADVTLNGTLETDGLSGTGIFARAYSGDLAIHNNGQINVSTSTISGSGIDALAQGNVTIDGAGSITTGRYDTFGYGTGAIGIEARSVGGSVTVNETGTITSGDYGVVAVAFDSQDASKGVDVTVGNVITQATGGSSTGIVAVDLNAGSHVAVSFGSVTTAGDYATGIAPQAFGGGVTVTGGAVTTRGNHAVGISSSGNDSTTIDVASVTTLGSYKSNAIQVIGNIFGGDGVVDISAGTVSTSGVQSSGIVSIAYGEGHVTAGTVTTLGSRALGIYARSGSPASSVEVGTLSTKGDGARGIVAIGAGDLSVSVDKSLSTAGRGATGVIAINGYGALSVKLPGAVSTTGDQALAVAVVSQYGDVDLSTGAVTTSGAGSNAIVGYSEAGKLAATTASVATTGDYSRGIFLVGANGVSLNAGSVETRGKGSTAIDVTTGGAQASGAIAITANSVVTHGDGSTGIGARVSTAYDDAKPTLTINAGKVSTEGLDSVGIFAVDGYGAIAVTASDVATKGAESVGIAAMGGDAITVNAGNVGTLATSIYASGSGSGAIAVSMSGAVSSSGADALDTINAGGVTTISIGTGGKVSGAIDAIHAQSGGGAITIANAGTIAGGAGYAIDVTGLQTVVVPGGGDASSASGDTTTTAGTVRGTRVGVALVAAVPQTSAAVSIANTGTIAGAVRLSGGDDTLTNTGSFVATKDSDFGAGTDLFVNRGVFAVQPGTKPGAVTLLGLETFRNDGGIVDLRNGVAGDTLTLPGAYVGANGARLGIDLVAGKADTLVVGGAATGSTGVLLNVGAANATLLASPVTIVRAGAGTSATAFTLANQNVGFVSYGLAFDAAGDSFALTSRAGDAVYRLARTTEAAQSIWRQSADAWSAHMAELRDVADPARRVWGQAYGKVDVRDGHRDIDGTTATTGYRQDYYGGQIGFDLVGRRADNGDGFLFGATGGYVSSRVNFRGSAASLAFDTVNAGGYGSLKAGPLFVNLLGQYDHYRVHAGDEALAYTSRFDGHGYGAQAEAGARLGSDRLFVEPLASIAWQRTDLGTLRALGQALDFDRDTAITGKAGGRIGGTVSLGGGSRAIFYAKAAYVHEFKGRGGLLFESGGTNAAIGGARIGDHGQAAIGTTIVSAGRVSGFIEGDGDVGGGVHGGGGRVGIDFKL